MAAKPRPTVAERQGPFGGLRVPPGGPVSRPPTRSWTRWVSGCPTHGRRLRPGALAHRLVGGLLRRLSRAARVLGGVPRGLFLRGL